MRNDPLEFQVSPEMRAVPDAPTAEPVSRFLARVRHARPFQFGIRSVLAITVLLALPLAWITSILRQARDETAAIKELRRSGIEVGAHREWPLLYERATDVSINLKLSAKQADAILRLKGTRIAFAYNGEDNPALFELLRETGALNQLDLQKNTVPPNFFHRLGSQLNLVSIDADECPLTADDLAGLASLIAPHTRLSLIEAGVTDASLDSLFQCQHIRLWKNPLTCESLTIMANDTVFDLELAETQVTDRGVENLTKFKNIRYLDLSMTRITGASGESLAKMGNLKRLNVSCNDLGDHFVAHLDDAHRDELWFPSLGLFDCGLTDASLPALGRIRYLQQLDLSANAVTDDGLRHLAGLKNLRILDLSNCPITDRGLQELKSLPALNQLRIYGTQITLKGVREFRRARPDCQVEGQGQPKLSLPPRSNRLNAARD